MLEPASHERRGRGRAPVPAGARTRPPDDLRRPAGTGCSRRPVRAPSLAWRGESLSVGVRHFLGRRAETWDGLGPSCSRLHMVTGLPIARRNRDVGRAEAREGERVRECFEHQGPGPDRWRPVRVGTDLGRVERTDRPRPGERPTGRPSALSESSALLLRLPAGGQHVRRFSVAI